ncbi:HCP-like protein, partial [Rhizophagus irregularis]
MYIFFRKRGDSIQSKLDKKTTKYDSPGDIAAFDNHQLEDDDNFAQEIERNENEIEIFKRYEKSAKQGDSDAQNYLGYLYENDLGVQKDLKKAFYWYQRSAENGNKLAHYNLISYYLDGWKIDEELKDSEKSFYWYLKSAENGNKFAQYNLGLYYQNGWGIEKDEIKAFKWYEKSAKQDNSDAQNYLGFLYKNGINIQKDLEKSFFWYQKSAINGNKIAQYNLGNFYRYGWGIDKDEIEAQKWYRELAGQHNKL